MIPHHGDHEQMFVAGLDSGLLTMNGMHKNPGLLPVIYKIKYSQEVTYWNSKF